VSNNRTSKDELREEIVRIGLTGHVAAHEKVTAQDVTGTETIS
jgi:hypothetical protein